MKYFNSVLFKSICVLALIFMNQSCENEFSEIGTDIVGTPGFEIKKKTYPVTTYNKKITPFLPIFSFGNCVTTISDFERIKMGLLR